MLNTFCVSLMTFLVYSTCGSGLQCYKETNELCESQNCGKSRCPFPTDVCHETQSMVADPRAGTIVTTVTRGCTARPPADAPSCSQERRRIRCTIYCDSDFCNTKSRLNDKTDAPVAATTKGVLKSSSSSSSSDKVSSTFAWTSSPTQIGTSGGTRLHVTTASTATLIATIIAIIIVLCG